MYYAIGILVMAVLTYLIRLLPLAFFKKQIQNKYVKSFLYYIPYAVLSAMTFPAIFYSTNNIYAGIAGFIIAAILSYFNRSLLLVAAAAAATSCIIILII